MTHGGIDAPSNGNTSSCVPSSASDDVAGDRMQSQPQRLTRRQARAALRLMGVALCPALLCILPLYSPPSDTFLYLLGATLLVLTGLPLAVATLKGSLDLFEPIQVISAIVGLNFAFRTLYVLYQPAALLQIAYPYDDQIGRALALTIAGYLALLCGYYLIPRLPFASGRYAPKHRWPERLDERKLFSLWLVGILATGWQIWQGEVVGRDLADAVVTGSTFLVTTASQAVQYSACIAALYSANRSGTRRLKPFLWFVVVPTSGLQAVAFGAKSSILMTLFMIAAARHYAGRRVRLLPVVAGICAIVLIVFPIMNVYRSKAASDPNGAAGNGSEVVDRIGGIVLELSELRPAEYLQLGLENVMARSNGIDVVSLLLKYPDGVAELRRPVDYLLIPAYAFVPRLLWSEKPTESAGVRFGRELVVPLSAASSSYTSFGMFHIGDLYLNFGAAGVVVGMLALGWLYRFFYSYCRPRRQSDFGVIFVYIVLLWAVANGFEADIPTVYGNLLKSLVVLVGVKMWLDARPGEVRAVAGVPSTATT
jgi:hypothetical protein